MRIGDTIDPRLSAVDYSAFLNANARATQSIGQSIGSAIGAVQDVVETRKKNKDTVKVSSDKIDAAIKLFGDQGGYLTGIRESLEDEDTPLSQRAALGGQIDEMLNLGIDKMRNDALMDIQERQVTVQEGEFEMRKRAAEFQLGTAEEARAEQERITEFTARPILENVLRQTQEAEARGESPLIPSEKLKLAFMKSPKEQSQIAATAYQGLPKPQPVELRDIEFTRDGQAMKGTAVFDPKAGAFQLVPIQDPTAAAVIETLPQGLEPYIGGFEAAGAKYGVDPKVLAAISMHETANGTSSAFRNKSNAMGISNASGPVEMESVAASIDKMARLLGSTQSGPYKNAQTIEEIAKIYAPIGAGNDPRGLNKHWVQGVKKNIEKLGGNPAAPVRIQPGAGSGPYGKRPDGTDKGSGWLGELRLPGGGVATEYTMQSDAVKGPDGKRVDFPTLVPTLTRGEIDMMVNDIIPNQKEIPEPIIQKAIDHAKSKIASGRSVFAPPTISGGYAGSGIQPGAPKATITKTPTEQAIDEAKLAKTKAEAAAAEKTATAEAGKAKAKADRLAQVESKFLTKDGKPSDLLRNATGIGEGAASFMRMNAPETRANQKELELELLETDLLEAAKDLKPVSEDEMKQLMARRPKLTDSPEEWAWFIKRARGILESGQAQTPSANPTQDETSRLRGMLGR